MRVRLGRHCAMGCAFWQREPGTDDWGHHAMKRITVSNLLAALGVAATCAAQAQRSPNDIDLKTAYCIPIVESTANLYKQIILAQAESNPQNQAPDKRQLIEENRQVLEEQISNLNRLKQYLLPRIPYLDPVALAAAQQRGKADYSALQAASKDQAQYDCVAQCITKQRDSGAQIGADVCVKQCVPHNVLVLLERVASCGSSISLPF